jgi:GNAT superfamily N-acetyltransferase
MSDVVTATAVDVRLLRETDLDEAERIFRLAFGTYLGLPDPLQFFEGASLVRGRWLTNPGAAFAADVEGELAGSNLATKWGSVGFFGPLTVRPDRQDRGIGKLLMEPVMECFERWGTSLAGLFTFAHSQKHVGLYQRFGFYPRYLTAIMAKSVAAGDAQPATAFSELNAADRKQVLGDCRELTNEIYAGLDLTREIEAVAERGIGETFVLEDGGRVGGFAVLHAGQGSEAARGTAFVKFAAVRAGEGAAERLDDLLEACEEETAQRGLERLDAGVNLGREEAYRLLLGRGYRTWLQGVAMHRPNDAGYNRPGVYVVDDWR